MAETPEEAAAKVLADVMAAEVRGDNMDPIIASALRAQYVAGLEAAKNAVLIEEEGPHGQSWQLGDVAAFRVRCIAVIRELAEQAKRAGRAAPPP